MSKLMLIAGVLLMAVAVALGVMIFISPGSVVGWGITSEFSAILFVGGVLSLGMGGVISALEGGAVMEVSKTTGSVLVSQTETPIPEFGRRTPPAPEEISPAVGETLKALEQARTGIQKAFGEEPRTPEPEPEPAAEPSPPAEEGGDQLYVVEERRIRNRQARVLSDGTVEAETDEGWMRFENLEHLDEYLDAMAPSERA